MEQNGVVSKPDFSKFSLLGILDAEEVANLDRSVVSITLPPDALILEAFQQPSQYRFLNEWIRFEENNLTPLYLLESGKVMLSKNYRQNTYEVAPLSSGDLFGESSHLLQQVGGSHFRTIETSIVHIIPTVSAAQLIRNNRKFRQSLEMLAERHLAATAIAVHSAFSLLPQSVREVILYNAQYMTLDSGELLVSQGQPDSGSMYLILNGSAHITAKHPDNGSEVVLAFESSGKELGDIAVVTGQPHPVTIKAASPLRLLCISSDSIKAWQAHHSDFAKKMKLIADHKQTRYSNTLLNAGPS